MILKQHISHVVLVLRRHRQACMMLARVQRNDGYIEQAQHLVRRARVVNRDVVSLLRVGERIGAVELVGVPYGG